MDCSPGPASDAALPAAARAAAPRPRAARCPGDGDGDRGPCGEDGLGLFRGLMLAAEFSAAFWLGVLLLARAVW